VSGRLTRLIDGIRRAPIMHVIFEVIRLGRVLGRWLARRPHEQDFAAFALFPDRIGPLLDIGANIGQSALSFRLFNRDSPIVAFEPNPRNRWLHLVKLVARRLTFITAAVGSSNEDGVLHVPSYGHRPRSGEAWLRDRSDKHLADVRPARRRRSSPVRMTIRPVPVAVVRIDDFDLTPDFIKIDVEGAELDVIAGFRRTLEQSQPVVLVEVGDRSSAISLAFESLGFAPFRYDRRAGRLEPWLGEAAQNLFFVASERT
jgi:FkbM family methyltransferase